MSKKNKRLKILSPKLPLELADAKCQEGQFADGEQLCGILFSNCILEDIKAEKMSFKQTVFRNVEFRRTYFAGADIEDARFENCDLSNMDLGGAIIHRTVFENCKMLGANFSGAALQNVIIDNCNACYVNFRFSNFKRTLLKESAFCMGDFQSSEFLDVTLEDDDLSKAQLSGTGLCGIDLSTCLIEGIGVRMEDVEGVMVSPGQAVLLSGLMGIVVKDM